LTSAVLDASALIALLRQEPGAGQVAQAIQQGAAMSTVNLAEVAGFFALLGIDEALLKADIAALRIEFISPDLELAFGIGYFVGATRRSGLSLGDRACLALAKRLAAPAVTADRKWADVASAAGVSVQLIR
jgi:PIN domain nuclease of toxin-antitoxin system